MYACNHTDTVICELLRGVRMHFSNMVKDLTVRPQTPQPRASRHSGGGCSQALHEPQAARRAATAAAAASADRAALDPVPPCHRPPAGGGHDPRAARSGAQLLACQGEVQRAQGGQHGARHGAPRPTPWSASLGSLAPPTPLTRWLARARGVLTSLAWPRSSSRSSKPSRWWISLTRISTHSPCACASGTAGTSRSWSRCATTTSCTRASCSTSSKRTSECLLPQLTHPRRVQAMHCRRHACHVPLPLVFHASGAAGGGGCDLSAVPTRALAGQSRRRPADPDPLCSLVSPPPHHRLTADMLPGLEAITMDEDIAKNIFEARCPPSCLLPPPITFCRLLHVVAVVVLLLPLFPAPPRVGRIAAPPLSFCAAAGWSVPSAMQQAPPGTRPCAGQGDRPGWDAPRVRRRVGAGLHAVS